MTRPFAARGSDLVLCARRTDRPQALRKELLTKHPARGSASAGWM